MCSLAPDAMVRRVYHCLCSIDSGLAAPAGSGKSCGVGREQMVIFLADTLRGTAEERAPLVMAMSQNGAGPSATVTCEQVAEVSCCCLCYTCGILWPCSFYPYLLRMECFSCLQFLQDLISAVVQILVHRGRLQGWKPERMGDGSLGVKLLAEQMCSELKPSGEKDIQMFRETQRWIPALTIVLPCFSDQGCCDVSCLEDWIFRVSQVSLYLEMLVAEGLNVSLSGRPAPTLLPPCRETPWKELKCLLDIPILMFLTPQVRKDILHALCKSLKHAHRCQFLIYFVPTSIWCLQLPDSYSAPWRLVFSTRLHGESFTRMVGGLMKRGPTLLLIKDTKGHVFGGFASHGWEVKPQFQGERSFKVRGASRRVDQQRLKFTKPE